jgi:hypothetical protein
LENIQGIIREALEKHFQSQQRRKYDWACGVTVRELEIGEYLNKAILGREFVSVFSKSHDDYHSYKEQNSWVNFRIDKETLPEIKNSYLAEESS